MHKKCSEPSTQTLPPELEETVEKWREQSARYFALSEKEENLIGKKYYTSYALALANCVFDILRAYGSRP